MFWRRPSLLLLTAAFVSPALPSASANVTFSLQGDVLKTETGAVAPAGSLFMLVASTANSTTPGVFSATDFAISSNLQPGTSTAVGTILGGGDDMIVFRGTLGSAGVLNQTGISIDFSLPAYQGLLGQNDRLALIWIPSVIGIPAVLPSGARFGFYDGGVATGANSTDADPSGANGSQSWVMPANGTLNYQLGLYTSDANTLVLPGTGSNPADVGRSLGLVPEPSTALLALLGSLSLVHRPRRVARR